MAVPDLQDAIEHLQQKDLDAAIAALKRKIEELPAHLTAHVLLARAYEAKHKWERSLKSWENVRFLMPNSPVGRDGKQRVLERIKGMSEAPAEEESSVFSADDDSSEDNEDDTPTTTTEAASELEELRRRAEHEARQGGARSSLAQQSEPSVEPPSQSGGASTPEQRIDQLEDDDDLDRLIDELESATIEPRPDVDDVPPPDLENDIDDLVSETLARIHEAQDQYRDAAQIYVKLASQEPDSAREYLEKAAEMREKAEAEAKNEESH